VAPQAPAQSDSTTAQFTVSNSNGKVTVRYYNISYWADASYTVRDSLKTAVNGHRRILKNTGY
jgi:hypothetical protein